jgi:predicted permease
MRKILGAVRNLFRRGRVENDLDAEIQSYESLLQDEKSRAGMNSREARRSARIEMGGPEQVKEEVRAARLGIWIETIWWDVRFGARMLRKKPGFTAAAVLTLALGIGANTAIFSVVYAVLLKPLPFKEPGRLVFIMKKNPPRDWTRNAISTAEFLAWREKSHAFESMAAFMRRSCVFTGAGEPEEDPCEVTSSNLFSLLGVSPVRGREFSTDEDKEGNSHSVILSFGLWQRRFGSQEDIIGRNIILNGASCTVVGVMPEGFSHLYSTPYSHTPELWISGIGLSPTSTWNDYFAIGRLRPGETFQQAESEMDPVSAEIDQTFPDLKGWRAQLFDLRTIESGDTRLTLLVMMGAVTFILLIACANVANLLLARSSGRAGEFAVRKALGAGQGRLVRQLLTESLLISLAGGALGILFALWGNNALIALAPSFLFHMAPGLANASINLRVLAFALSATFATTLLFGLAPAIQGARLGVSESLKEAGRSSLRSTGSRVFRDALVVSEIALAMVLLVGAGLMIRTLANIGHASLGINPSNILTMRIPRAAENSTGPEARAEFWRRVVEGVEAIPGVASASVSRGLPIGDWTGQFFTTEDNPNPSAEKNPDANYIVAGPNYFRVTGIPLRAGRAFNEHDVQTGDRVVIVNEQLAKMYWPGQQPLGKRVRMGSSNSKAPWLTVVGVAANVYTQGLDEEFHSEIYVSFQQYPLVLTPDRLLIRTAPGLNPASFSHAVLDAIHRVDKNQPATDIRTMEQAAQEPIAQQSWIMRMLGIFAGLALLLSAVGIYSVLSYAVAQRTHEFGIRMALGAQHGNVLRLVLGSGARLAASGIILGIAGALALTQLMTDFLYGVRPTDPLTFVAVAIVLTAASYLACYVPARRATRVDPILALRYE